MKIMEVNRISASICHSYERNDSELTENIQELSISNDFYVMMESGGRVLLFMPESDSILPVYQYKDQLPKLKAMLDASKSNSGCVSYKINSGVENYSTLAYARYLRKAPGNEVYLYIFSPLYPVSSTVDILKNQLFYVTIITLFGAFSLAIYFANRISRPIKSITTTAKEMGRGNYDVKFRGNSYSEINNLAETLNTAAYELGNADARQKDLIANVSHDLKTPLTAIITYVNLLKIEQDPERQKEYIDVLDRKSLRLKALIEDLFEISKASSKSVNLNIANIDIVNLFKQVKLEMEEKITEANLDFRLDIPEDKVIVALDGQKTYRIFENLIGNAAKYAMPHTRVYVKIAAEDGDAVFQMKNVSANELTFNPEEITERFVRGDSSRNTEGSGLGLAIVKSFVEIQKGKFWIETEADLFKAEIRWKLVDKKDDIA